MSADSDRLAVTARSQVRRARERGRYDRAYIEQTLDASVLCHLGFVDDEQPVVTPTIHWRMGEYLYWHGAKAARYMLASAGARVCVTVTHLDGLVLARSAFHHSANYRSVMVFGQSEAVTERAHKEAALKAMVEKLYRDRWDQLRPMSTGEFEGTAVARVVINEASAKVRSGPPIDDAADYSLPIWAGVVPVTRSFGAAVEDPGERPGLERPNHVDDLHRRFQ